MEVEVDIPDSAAASLVPACFGVEVEVETLLQSALASAAYLKPAAVVEAFAVPAPVVEAVPAPAVA